MAQKFIRGLHNLRAETHGVVATIGTFDGIHLGHQAIFTQVCEKARAYGVPSMVMIFEPHPMEFFSHQRAPARLMRMHEKIAAIYAEGIDSIFCLQFNPRLRQLSAGAFVEQVLVDGIGVRCLVVGDDFHFGCDRRGDSTMLKAAGALHHFEVIDTATVVRNGRRISSTWVRECLEVGDISAAEHLLGKPFRISGKVVHGQSLGRTLGVPTANVFLHRYRVPLSGVFVVEVLLAGQRLPAVANVGVRPTVGDLAEPILEVHLLDWEGDLYGQRITVEFIERLRSERQFAGVDQLLTQIHLDIDLARHYFTRR